MRRAVALFVLATLAGCGRHVEHDPRLANASLPERLAAADPRAGAAIFAQCAACHSIAPGAGDRAGPNLYAVPGRAVAQGSPNFNYSAALRSVGGVWTFDRLDTWLTSPSHFAPGTNMMFAGLHDGMDRADVIRLLNDNGSKLPLPPVVSQRNRPDR